MGTIAVSNPDSTRSTTSMRVSENRCLGGKSPYGQSRSVQSFKPGEADMLILQTDEMNFETVLWPRAAAVAELFWTGAGENGYPRSQYFDISLHLRSPPKRVRTDGRRFNRGVPTNARYSISNGREPRDPGRATSAALVCS
jgi:hypothetical protein